MQNMLSSVNDRHLFFSQVRIQAFSAQDTPFYELKLSSGRAETLHLQVNGTLQIELTARDSKRDPTPLLAKSPVPSEGGNELSTSLLCDFELRRRHQITYQKKGRNTQIYTLRDSTSMHLSDWSQTYRRNTPIGLGWR